MKRLSIIIAALLLLLTSCAGFDPHPRPWTTTEQVLAGASILAAFADWRTQMEIFDNGGYELNPIIGKKPSDGKFGVYMGLSQLGVFVFAHLFPDALGPRTREILLGGKTIANGVWAIRNSGQY